MKKLTAQVLRDAADRLSADGYGNGETFMCFAIEAAIGSFFYSPERKEFEAILTEDGISTDGNLTYKGRHYSFIDNEKSQALRFDFLNLLAESME
jgi:hypothetical protein